MKKSTVFITLLVMSGVIFFTGCERDYNTLGVDIVDDGASNIQQASFDVKAYNRKLSAVRTDGLSSYQLADYNQEIFGEVKASFATQLALSASNPTFGNKSQSSEQSSSSENERVTAVYLHIPFFSTLLGDTINDSSTRLKEYRLDSIFGNKNASFTVQVNEYTKFLRNLDPDSNFQEAKEYFSNEDPTEFIGQLLYDDVTTINKDEILYFDNEDDPSTPDKDESREPSERLAPRLRLALDTQFFQDKIIDQEGSLHLQNASNFQEYFRGIYVQMEAANKDLAMLLDVANGYVEIRYEFDTQDNNGDDIVSEKSFKMTFNANTTKKVNFIEQQAYPQEIADQFNGQDAANLYINSGVGSIAELDMSNGSGEALNDLQQAVAEGWLINEANLVFYVNQEESVSELPKRMYLYDYTNERPLVDYSVDLNQDTGIDSTSYAIFDGRLVDNGKGPHYKFRVTNYINDLLRKDSLNIQLGLSTTNNILNPSHVSALLESDGSAIKIPQASVSGFSGVVLYGNNVPADKTDKQLKLEVYYTELK